MKHLIYILILLIILPSCATQRQEQFEVIVIDEPIEITTSRFPRETPPRFHNLIHTRLEVEPEWETQYLHGKATLTMVPYFYPQNSVILDAKGFIIKQVMLVDDDSSVPLTYTYDQMKLTIHLDSFYSNTDTFSLFIDYIARPNEQIVIEGVAIAQNKGLYFINPLGEEPGKPRQIWTQGQPESNSKWFPTFDQPNERTSQEIFITVDTHFVTLSNGSFIYSMEIGNGKRTDYWRQNLPHAPYLFMMAVGEFAEVKNYWRDTLDVFYFVEPEYEKYAEMVFGKTPEMIEFFSNLLGYDYPWDKYHQVVVRDFVSGAMENTGAVIFFDAMQHDRRAHLDNPLQDIIAHELAHHWFGNLVTTESWANLALNESFATYCEYLWNEYKYGRGEADYKQQVFRQRYFDEAQHKKESLIRPFYTHPNQLFDRHTYQKGGLILHMLRKQVGSEAFFEALKYYLHDRQFNSAEYTHLRLAFEEITGLDMNWFFDQWFLSPGHPVLEVQTIYTDTAAIIITRQKQDLNEFPLYRLPVKVDVYQGTSGSRHEVVVRNITDTFVIPLSARPSLVNFDAEKMLLAEIMEEKSPEHWMFQFQHGPLYHDKYEALEGVFRHRQALSESRLMEFIIQAMNDGHWNIRRRVIELLAVLDSNWVENNVMPMLIQAGKHDEKAAVRVAAINRIGFFQNSSYLDHLGHATMDSSYMVVASALAAINAIDTGLAREYAKPYRNTNSFHVLNAMGRMYQSGGRPEDNSFYMQALMRLTGRQRYNFLAIYGQYLQNAGPAEKKAARPLVENMKNWSSRTWERQIAENILEKL